MAFEHSWRWFGPDDPVTLAEVRQAGATGIVSALHHIPVGRIWTVGEIMKRKRIIEAAGLKWTAVESLSVHEDIKKRSGGYREYIQNYLASIRNLGQCGIDTVCYNFMPVLDWVRTDLNAIYRDGSITTRFDTKVFAAFDMFILKRPGAEQDYGDRLLEGARRYYQSMNENQKEELTRTALLGLPGSLETYTLAEFKSMLQEYRDIGKEDLRQNLCDFLKAIIPAAEESGVYMTIHPDDPPWSLLGLPRIAGSESDIEKILNMIDSPSNGLALCSGSLGAGFENDLPAISQRFAGRINFIHLRNVQRNENGDFVETAHLEGDINLYEVMKTLIVEQQKRIAAGRKDVRMPMRPDHGLLLLPEQHKKGIYPGYSLFGRMKALAELRGMETAIMGSLNF